MNAKKISLLIAALFTGLLMLNGCRKSEPAPSETSTMTMEEHEGHDHAATAEKAGEEVAAATVQTTCPVMGGAINKALFTEYKGKKVYFCCEGCKEKFEAEPEKYIAKLPQSNQ